MKTIVMDGRALTLAEICAVAEDGCRVELSQEARARVAESRAVIEAILTTDESVYGVNTGFGLSLIHI